MKKFGGALERLLNRYGFGVRTRLIVIFLVVNIIPLIVLAIIAWRQIAVLGEELKVMAVDDSSKALNDSAVENIERMTTDTALKVAEFLYDRDDDIRYLAGLAPTEENYSAFAGSKYSRVIRPGEWELSADGSKWVPVNKEKQPLAEGEGKSNNSENNDMNGFHYRQSDGYEYQELPLYDEITFIDLEGNEIIKITTDSSKVNYPMNPNKRNVSDKANTYIKAETYYPKLSSLKPGEIYVSDVIGTYVGSNYIGMYTPGTVAKAAADRGYDIEYNPEEQSYAGMENPNGQRFEGIVRWATPVTGDNGEVIGYVTMALNHDHIMEFVDHITPMNERYTELPNAYDGNYAFIWDYQCRSICHPRHNSIVGYDPETGDPQIPWLESSIYDRWQESGLKKWTDYAAGIPTFDNQSRSKKPAPFLTQMGFVGLDGRYLNNAPQCTGWMDLTRDGGSGSFYILWSGLYKLTTAGAIPYYTGQYAPSEENGFSRRGFGIVTIGAGLEDFTRPATETGEKLTVTIGENQSKTSAQLIGITIIIIILVVLIAIWVASSLTGNITALVKGISRFRAGERQYRFDSQLKDEFGTLADCFDEMADSIEDSVKNPLVIIDRNRNVIYMNDYGLALCHSTLDEIVGTPYGDSSIYPAGSKYCPITALEEGREAEIFYDEEVNQYVRGTANYFQDKNGRQLGYIIQTNDVTDMVLEQMKIEEQRTLLDKVFTASPDLIWYMDAKGNYMTVNPRFSSIAGISPEECVSRNAVEVLPQAIAEGFNINDGKALESTLPLYSEETIRFADGHEEILESVRTPIIDPSGKLVGLLGFARDVTTRVTMDNELRSTQIDLEQAVEEANRANEHKGEFLARMSHEIRTPMNAIIGITNIVLKRLDESDDIAGDMDEVKGHVRQIEASSQHLLGLLNDILDISKIEAGKIELSEEAVELAKLNETVAGIIRPRCDEKNITFNTHFDRFEDTAFLTDSLRLRQVLINLLGNAVKFTPECGDITFRVSRLDSREGETLVGFSVKDSGIGISEEALTNIFQPFEQANNKISRQYGGTGLGLAISRSIVQLLGGDIAIDSELGEGSEFHFQIWMKETACDTESNVELEDATGKFTGKRMLLVDDVEINRVIVISMLENTGIEIDEADDGEVAVKMFEESENGTYDIIFMDVLMPNMDGYEASTTIRGLDRPDAATVPIITLTANAFKDDIDKALRHGMDAHISKPVEMDRMLEILFRYLTDK